MTVMLRRSLVLLVCVGCRASSTGSQPPQSNEPNLIDPTTDGDCSDPKQVCLKDPHADGDCETPGDVCLREP